MAEKKEPCLSCKLISIGCFLGIGGYMFYLGRAQTKLTKYTFYSIGLGVTGLGFGEIFDKSPFRSIE